MRANESIKGRSVEENRWLPSATPINQMPLRTALKTRSRAHCSSWINRRATPAMLPAPATTERSQDLFMNWHAAGLRRLDGIIWAIIAIVAGLVLASPLLSNFQLVW